MPTSRIARVTSAHGPIELVSRDVPAPGPGAVRIRVEACGICHSDVITKDAVLPGIQYPRAPGHEIAGTIDAVGSGVAGFSAGDRVGVAGTADTAAPAIRAAAATS
jgi:D-arabinose 1-dehydrogenase-like Zn-dependent alcohol dehydrogenase